MTGTNYFISFEAAVNYYRPYNQCLDLHELEDLVQTKIDEGDIAIACPYDPKGCPWLDKREGRWFLFQ